MTGMMFPESLGDPEYDKLPPAYKKRLYEGFLKESVGLVPGNLDQDTGVPGRERIAEDVAGSPEDKLNAVRKYHPEAQPYGDGNYVFKGREGKATLFNPPGFDPGDIPGSGSMLAEYGGAALGAAAGAPLGVPGMALGAGAGGVGAKEGYRGLVRSAMGIDDTRSTSNRLLDAGLTAAFDAGGELIVPGAGAVARHMFGPRAGVDMAQRARDFAEAGVPPDMGSVTGSRFWQQTQKASGNLPGGSRTMQEAERRQQEAGAEGVQREIQGLGGAQGKQEVGRRLQQGAEDAGTRFDRVQGRLYDAAYARIGENSGVNLTQTGQLLEEARRELQTGRRQNVWGPVVQHLERIMQPTRMPDGSVGYLPVAFGELRRMRTDIGKMMEEPPIGNAGSSAVQPMLRRLYGTLTDDMNAAARQYGGAHELEIADRFTREFNQPQGPGPVLTEMRDKTYPEQAFNWALQGGRDGASKLMRFRRQINPADWDSFRGQVLQELGRAKGGFADQAVETAGGNFSFNTFLTNWENMLAPETKTVLFGTANSQALRHALDRLVRVGNNIRDTARSTNFSNTANIGMHAATTGGMAAALYNGDPASATTIGVMGYVAPFVGARLATSPRFINWMAGAMQSVARNPGAMGGWLGRLASIGEAEPELKPEITAMIQGMIARARSEEPEQATPGR